MKTLLQTRDLEEIQSRIAAVSPSDERLWGRMTVHGMLCHLADAFRMALCERPANETTSLWNRTVLKWIAIHTPLPWPQGFKTLPEIDQGIGGTAPVDFEADREALLHLLDRFLSLSPTQHVPHPIFGRLTQKEWMRWGYLHTDHHLRQFGR